MPLPPLPDSAVVLGATASSWRDALRLAGGALVSSGAATEPYTDAMIGLVEEHGPYIVISPGLAFAHARPGPAVLRDGLSVVTLDAPVSFGHPHNDPVRVVLGLAVAGVGTHLESIGEIANLFNDASVTGRIADAATADEVRAIMGVTA
ncbi:MULTISPECIES: PTS sugar transporter subunit IIA [unclassified Curtobacterium]|jgi:PTS system ascorbate-specific IIA component|uniref:PTS sugar transporter subunit IIA n=1 Tax=unclassified Curtobacterium TaxID=257496 RepID=UPI00089E00D3|nr:MULTISPECIES: PTS sugar transporter subunit IIA [unclassified Curtobacterium]AOX66744.1 PTS ascorbate transporter subunit IIA [Curtobacterium sp. BH-2-1-1]MCC8908519.1 PTS sugar transporter subunit IIA [Curtobacterium sp. GD1]MCT9622226.1 PTS sugar transporter subunit IIA [Curtobacterium sp. C2H10]MDR6172195.1 PTS system ascorbate-specific IIA component [Curtobacterium sp. SORGH_AS_0776]MDR6571940.1 PTS system ascorbate-specific IIA component [Curtobacterium sp. 320]